MYVYDRESSGLNHSGTTTSSRLGWDGLSYRRLGQVGSAVPIVSAFRFQNNGIVDPENCCAGCTALPATDGRSNLGVGLRGNGTIPLAAANGMELAFTISGHRSNMEYDITRTMRSSMWQRVGGVWTSLESFPMGTGDDPHPDTDECLRLSQSNRIFVIDTPGWWEDLLPIPASRRLAGVSRTVADAAATELVVRDSFAEWVIARNRAEGIPWTRLQLPLFRNGTPRPYIYWHNIVWLVRNPAGNPTGQWVLGPRSAIALGSLSATVINSAPA